MALADVDGLFKETKQTKFTTLLISGGRKDKISKGDVAGFMIKTGGVSPKEVGVIEIKQDCAFVAIPEKASAKAIKNCNNQRIKKRKVRVYAI